MTGREAARNLRLDGLTGVSSIVYDGDVFRHFTFMVLGDQPYRGSPATSKHLITQRLSMTYPVYYVDPPPALFRGLGPANRSAPFPPGVTEAEYNLKVVTPPAVALPLSTRARGIDALGQVLLGSYLRRLFRAEKVRNFILWSFRYNSNHVMQILRPDVAVYHSVGRYNDVEPGSGNRVLMDEIEAMTVASAHLVFTSSDLLFRQFAWAKKETCYAPMGVDFKLFHTALRAELKLPDDLAPIPEPRVGYVGHMEHWLDLPLLEHLAESMPDVSFVYIGRYGPWFRIDPLLRHRNVFMLGPRQRTTLPAYLKGMNACLIPFKLNELTRHSHPMKIYEYLAAGKPVVSTPIHEVEKFGEFIEIAGDPREFAAKLRQAIVDRDINRANARAEIARHYSWNQRVAEMLEKIGQFVLGAGPPQ